ncbi:MAG: hypothetical protein BWY78_01515 [Alphaproteobacteria bacterium ADurb.Bin438]|nr:MAG: hypothetical protein BWY78_01515 [Alphaproteobacteria bacterium ADurb.Bin438]
MRQIYIIFSRTFALFCVWKAYIFCDFVNDIKAKPKNPKIKPVSHGFAKLFYHIFVFKIQIWLKIAVNMEVIFVSFLYIFPSAVFYFLTLPVVRRVTINAFFPYVKIFEIFVLCNRFFKPFMLV